MAKLLLILLVGLVFESIGVVLILTGAACISYSEHVKSKPGGPSPLVQETTRTR